MSTASFVQVSKRFQRLLQEALDADPDVTPRPRVLLQDPITVPSDQDSARLSLWLYQVTTDEFARNTPVSEAEDPQKKSMVRFQMPPLGVNLFYLITPVLGNPESEQQALARVLLTMYENPLLTVSQRDAEVNERVRVSLMAESLDERIKLWESLAKPYRLGLIYQVRTVRLASARIDPSTPVRSATLGSAEPVTNTR